MGFYNTFQKLIDKADYIFHGRPTGQTILEDTPEKIIKMAYSAVESVARKQTLLEDHEDYYVAIDSKTDVKYVCFKKVMMIDLDTKNYPILSETVVKNFFNSNRNYSFRIHRTLNGFHIFITSRLFDYRTEESIKFMLENFCDFYYCLFAFIRGYSCRLTPKPEELKPIYIDLGDFGNKDLVKKDIDKLIIEKVINSCGV